MLDFISHSKAGQNSYIAIRKRGTVDIWHDSQRWVYRQNRKGLKSFKNDIYYAFSKEGSIPVVKITGKFPSYTIQTFS